jgi:hypothetical protein
MAKRVKSETSGDVKLQAAPKWLQQVVADVHAVSSSNEKAEHPSMKAVNFAGNKANLESLKKYLIEFAVAMNIDTTHFDLTSPTAPCD